MTFTDLFVRRPVLALVVSTLILLLGLFSLGKLPIRQYPLLESSTITVTTEYPGASADLSCKASSPSRSPRRCRRWRASTTFLDLGAGA